MNKETRFGLTYGQILSTISLLVVIIVGYGSLQSRLTELETRIEQNEKMRIENTNSILRLYQENREDHGKIMEKLDKVIDKLGTKQDKL